MGEVYNNVSGQVIQLDASGFDLRVVVPLPHTHTHIAEFGDMLTTVEVTLVEDGIQMETTK